MSWDSPCPHRADLPAAQARCRPQASPITVGTFNYAPIALAVVLVVATFRWFATARRRLRGPVSYGRPDEVAAMDLVRMCRGSGAQDPFARSPRDTSPGRAPYGVVVIMRVGITASQVMPVVHANIGGRVPRRSAGRSPRTAAIVGPHRASEPLLPDNWGSPTDDESFRAVPQIGRAHV